MPDVRGAGRESDFHFIERDEPEKIAATLVKMVKERIPQASGWTPSATFRFFAP